MGYWVAVITQRSIVDPIAEQPSFLATRTSVLTLPVTAYLVLIPADRVGEAVFASI